MTLHMENSIAVYSLLSKSIVNSIILDNRFELCVMYSAREIKIFIFACNNIKAL